MPLHPPGKVGVSLLLPPGLVVYACRCTPKVGTLGRRTAVGRC